MLKEASNIDEATLTYFKNRLSSINKDFLRSDIVREALIIPYKIEFNENELEQVQLLAPALPVMNILGYQGSNMLALPK